MTTGGAAFHEIQAAARSTVAKSGGNAPTQEYLIRHTLESFLDRLTRTTHHGQFVLKGGVLLAAYGARRPTRDADSNAISADVTAEHLVRVVRDIAAIEANDGVVFDTDTISTQEIREEADYPAFRVRVTAEIGPWAGTAVWDVSTGDPMVPPPRLVTLERVLGNPISLFGYAPETTIAEKAVTILERGIASTRWRDYVDIVQLAGHGIDPTHYFARRGPLPATAESPLNLLPRISSVMVQWHKRSGLRGAAKNNLSQFARKPSTNRSTLSPISSTPSSPMDPSKIAADRVAQAPTRRHRQCRSAWNGSRIQFTR